ncbi:lipopolysaccharide biosynthesis protein [Moheibacter sediminis]|uniref:Membrane protein involved in the export of O-antigen and teichoic acid n=1 Tax=Moheibacter sediminis TaxID=1434700 RepID=A0A1W1YGL1_9FLAO|nr:oligosaccharide flippase family protein [Moheibacter sediminis]SMC35283.1 Membrane protein involved in the export of O-antigen and teichoic acid [Moheibacter sediminis]
MKSLIEFIRQFLSNQGLLVFLSSIISKLSMLFAAVIASNLISPEEYGRIALILSVFTICFPLLGMGSSQGLLRFGVLEKNKISKQQLSDYVFWKGFVNNIFISLIYIIVCIFYAWKYDGILLISIFIGIRLTGYYFFNHIQAYYRMMDDNRTYSIMNIFTNLAGVALVAVLTYFFEMIGYLISMAVMPWFCLFYFKKNPFPVSKPKIDFRKFWHYSIHASLTYFFSDLLFSMDYLLIGLMLNETSLALYKNAVMLPLSLSFLPLIFMQTDYPKIAKNYENKTYLKFYIINYYKIFIPIGILTLIVGFFIKDWIVPFIFGENYAGNGWVFFTILAALVGNMWMRNLYGNMSSAIGKAHWNTYTSVGALIIILLLGVLLIPSYGIMGAVIGMGAAFTFTGIIGMILFHNYLRNLKHE